MSNRLRIASLAFVSTLTLAGCHQISPAQIEPIDSAIELGSASASHSSASATPSPSPSGGAPNSSSSPAASASASVTDPDTSEDDDTNDDDSDANIPGVVYDKDAELEIYDQSGDGRSVVIEEFELGIDNVWLVICTESGSVLANIMTSTQSKPVTINLTRAVTTDQELVAVLYLDDGDGVFEKSQDTPVHEEPGESVEEDFEYDVY